MIKPLHTVQLSSAKPRTGLQSIADLLPRLIRQYEMQAELARKHDGESNGASTPAEGGAAQAQQQVTFGWYR